MGNETPDMEAARKWAASLRPEQIAAVLERAWDQRFRCMLGMAEKGVDLRIYGVVKFDEDHRAWQPENFGAAERGVPQIMWKDNGFVETVGD